MKIVTNKSEEKRVLEIFEEAFKDSPGINWMANKSQIKHLLNLFIYEARLSRGTFLTTNKKGAVLFYQLQSKKNSVFLLLKKLFLVFFMIGIKKGIKIIKYKKLIDQNRPKTGWLGWLVASDQNTEGHEAAYEIKREMFRMADETNQPIFVETTVPRVRKLYRIAGYIEYKAIPHPYENLTIWFMRRDPKN